MGYVLIPMLGPALGSYLKSLHQSFSAEDGGGGGGVMLHGVGFRVQGPQTLNLTLNRAIFFSIIPCNPNIL